MFVYKMLGVKEIYAINDLIFVKQLRNRSYTESQNLRAFMEQVSERASIWDGSIVASDQVEKFVSDLKSAGFLQVEEIIFN